MNLKERIRRIRAVRRLREVRERQMARALREAQAALSAAARRLQAAEAASRSVRAGAAQALAAGTHGPEVAQFHFAWKECENRRFDAARTVSECKERIHAAIGDYRRARIEKKRMESWESATVTRWRSEEDHRAAVAADEIAVIRYGWRKGA